MTSRPRPVGREVVLGRNSKVWRSISGRPELADRFGTAIGHDDLEQFKFLSTDRVWVFSYSRFPEHNTQMLERLAAAGISEVVYVSSASTIIAGLTQCYQYPRVKQHAAMEARRRFGARVLCLGLVYEAEFELPPGLNAATSIQELVDFMLAPTWNGDRDGDTLLFKLVDVPIPGMLERRLFTIYDAVQWRLRFWPCLLRPVDFVLRMLGYRWYGYTHLSNRLWSTTTS